MADRVDFIPTKRRSKFGGHVYYDKRNYAEREAIRAAYTGGVHEGPFRLVIEAHKRLPASRPKRIKSEPNTSVPDADNIAKSFMDALNGLAYEDDRACVELVVRKLDKERIPSDYCTFEVIEA